MTTVAGLLRSIASNLSEDQAGRHPETAAKIYEFLVELDDCATGRRAFTLAATTSPRVPSSPNWQVAARKGWA